MRRLQRWAIVVIAAFPFPAAVVTTAAGGKPRDPEVHGAQGHAFDHRARQQMVGKPKPRIARAADQGLRLAIQLLHAARPRQGHVGRATRAGAG